MKDSPETSTHGSVRRMMRSVIAVSDTQSANACSPAHSCRFFQSASLSSRSNCSFKCRRAAFLIARRSAATACFSACRSRRVCGSTDCDTCRILGRRAPTLRSFGFAYGSIMVTKVSVWGARTYPRFESGDMSPQSKLSALCWREK